MARLDRETKAPPTTLAEAWSDIQGMQFIEIVEGGPEAQQALEDIFYLGAFAMVLCQGRIVAEHKQDAERGRLLFADLKAEATERMREIGFLSKATGGH